VIHPRKIYISVSFLNIRNEATHVAWFYWSAIVALVVVAVHDITQRRHSILRIFPIVGHIRYWLEHIGPELLQYIVASDNEERPFSRAQRRWVYASSKSQNNHFGFGTSIDVEQHANHLIIKHSSFPLDNPQPGQPGYDPHTTRYHV